MKNKKIGYLLAFLIPALLMILIYACVGIYPFGNKSLLTVDMAGQYVSFFNALKNIFNGDIGIFYSLVKAIAAVAFKTLCVPGIFNVNFPRETPSFKTSKQGRPLSKFKFSILYFAWRLKP